MYTEETIPHLGCKDCKYFNNDCKRVDGILLQFAKSCFACCVNGFHIPCNDFVPKHPEYADLKEYTTFEEYWELYKKVWLPYSNANTYVPIILNQNEEVRYLVPLMSFINGTMVKDGKLLAEVKEYYKRTKKDFGYKLIKEKINGVYISKEE